MYVVLIHYYKLNQCKLTRFHSLCIIYLPQVSVHSISRKSLAVVTKWCWSSMLRRGRVRSSWLQIGRTTDWGRSSNCRIHTADPLWGVWRHSCWLLIDINVLFEFIDQSTDCWGKDSRRQSTPLEGNDFRTSKCHTTVHYFYLTHATSKCSKLNRFACNCAWWYSKLSDSWSLLRFLEISFLVLPKIQITCGFSSSNIFLALERYMLRRWNVYRRHRDSKRIPLQATKGKKLQLPEMEGFEVKLTIWVYRWNSTQRYGTLTSVHKRVQFASTSWRMSGPQRWPSEPHLFHYKRWCVHLNQVRSFLLRSNMQPINQVLNARDKLNWH